jgi:hypothetical protein
MRNDAVSLSESSHVGAGVVTNDVLVWKCERTIKKFWTPREEQLKVVDADELVRLSSEEQLRLLTDQGLEPYEVLERVGNLLMYGGASCLWECLIGNGTATASNALTYFNNSQAAIGVGDSTTAAAATQNDLSAATNKLRKAMDATYPTHTDGTASGNASISFRSTFANADANYHWQEWIVANSVTNATGRALNRKVEDLGTKVSTASWQFTVTLTLA